MVFQIHPTYPDRTASVLEISRSDDGVSFTPVQVLTGLTWSGERTFTW